MSYHGSAYAKRELPGILKGEGTPVVFDRRLAWDVGQSEGRTHFMEIENLYERSLISRSLLEQCDPYMLSYYPSEGIIVGRFDNAVVTWNVDGEAAFHDAYAVSVRNVRRPDGPEAD